MKKTLVFSICAIMVFALLVAGCKKTDGGEQAEKEKQQKLTATVSTAPVAKQGITLSASYSASLEGEKQANIVAKLPERITDVLIKIGDQVKQGQVVIKLDKAGATSQFYQAQAALLSAERELNRMKALLSEGAISQQMVDGLQTQFDIAKANFDAVKSSVEITAPINGVITALNCNPGDLATPGLPLAVVADINRMKAVFHPGEADITMFRSSQQVQISSGSGFAENALGSVQQISKTADADSRTFEVKAVFANTANRYFKPGMYCSVSVQLIAKQNILVVPNVAVLHLASGTGVFVVENGTARFIRLELGITDGTVTEVLSGISGAEQLVISGQSTITDGARVQVVNK